MVAVVIPTYNERQNISRLISNILDSNEDIQIVVVDDNSPDGTGKVVEAISNTDERVHLLNSAKRKGRGSAELTGFRYALTLGADYILEMDADFSHKPEYITKFLDKIKTCDVVIGSRYLKADSDKRGFLRRMISKLGKFYTRQILNVKTITDPTSGYRCFRRNTLEKINLDSFYSKGPFIITEILYRCYTKKFQIKEIPIIFEDRKKGRSKLSFFTILGYPFRVLRLKFYLK